MKRRTGVKWVVVGVVAVVPAGCPVALRRVITSGRPAGRDDLDMPLDDALGALLAFVGHRVDVAIESPASGLVAQFSGELVQGHEMSAREDERAPLFFSFHDGAS